ncbi:MAG: BON domain-containing protein, partial [Isosphaeraceae bacterium]|nr:BON domain-containing protein [Isosphaeraceae bacterium]
MKRELALLGLGAGLMYYFDPDRGRRRRGLVRDQLQHLAHQVGDALEATARDVWNRTCGLRAEVESRFNDGSAPDDVIEARVRSKLGRVVSHPRAIHVAARGGLVMLSGPILASEVDRLLATVASVRGVSGVEDHLEVHKHPGHHPALQGGVNRSSRRTPLTPRTWSPATRLLVGLAAGAAAWPLMKRLSPTTLTLGALGVGLLWVGLAKDQPARAHRLRRRDRPRRGPERVEAFHFGEPLATPHGPPVPEPHPASIP